MIKLVSLIKSIMVWLCMLWNNSVTQETEIFFTNVPHVVDHLTETFLLCSSAHVTVCGVCLSAGGGYSYGRATRERSSDHYWTPQPQLWPCGVRCGDGAAQPRTGPSQQRTHRSVAYLLRWHVKWFAVCRKGFQHTQFSGSFVTWLYPQ